MKLSTLQKLGGLSLIIGAALLTVYSICFSTLLPVKEIRHDFTVAVLNVNWIWTASVAFFGVIFMIFGFTAVYSKLYKGSGVFGFLGYIFVTIAYILQACKVTWEIFLYPVISSNQSSASLLRDLIIQHNTNVIAFRILASMTIFLGIILFCIALVRSGEFPKIAGILIFAGALLYGFGPVLTVLAAISGIVIFSIGCLILGLKLIRGDSSITISRFSEIAGN